VRQASEILVVNGSWLVIGVQAVRGGQLAPSFGNFFKSFRQNADDSGKHIEEKTS